MALNAWMHHMRAGCQHAVDDGGKQWCAPIDVHISDEHDPVVNVVAKVFARRQSKAWTECICISSIRWALTICTFLSSIETKQHFHFAVFSSSPKTTWWQIEFQIWFARISFLMELMQKVMLSKLGHHIYMLTKLMANFAYTRGPTIEFLIIFVCDNNNSTCSLNGVANMAWPCPRSNSWIDFNIFRCSASPMQLSAPVYHGETGEHQSRNGIDDGKLSREGNDRKCLPLQTAERTAKFLKMLDVNNWRHDCTA